MIYILIFIGYHYSGTAEFSNHAACDAAVATMSQDHTLMAFGMPKFWCVPKGNN